MPDQPPSAAETAAQVPPPSVVQVDGLRGVASLDEQVEKKVDEIEMIGEEEAAGWHASGRHAISPGMRYLHCSRTIHQLVTDRNRLAVVSDQDVGAVDRVVDRHLHDLVRELDHRTRLFGRVQRRSVGPASLARGPAGTARW